MQTNLTIASNGRVVIPASIRNELGLRGGETLIARLVDGAVVLEPVETAVARAQAMVRQYIPANCGLVEELITQRHKASQDE